MPVESCLSGLRGASVNSPRCSSGKILKLKILWHGDDDTQPPASSHAELAGKIQLSLRSPSEDDDLEVSCKACVPLLYPLMISESFPPLSPHKDFPVNISATAECVHLPQISVRTWPPRSWARVTSDGLQTSCVFHGRGLAVGQVSLAGNGAAKKKKKKTGSNFCDFNRLSNRSEKFHSGVGNLDEDVVVCVVQLAGQVGGVLFLLL